MGRSRSRSEMKTKPLAPSALEFRLHRHRSRLRPRSGLHRREDRHPVNVTAKDASGVDTASNSGLVEITYDTEALTLVDVKEHAAYHSTVKADGSVVPLTPIWRRGTPPHPDLRCKDHR